MGGISPGLLLGDLDDRAAGPQVLGDLVTGLVQQPRLSLGVMGHG